MGGQHQSSANMVHHSPINLALYLSLLCLRHCDTCMARVVLWQLVETWLTYRIIIFSEAALILFEYLVDRGSVFPRS